MRLSQGFTLVAFWFYFGFTLPVFRTMVLLCAICLAAEISSNSMESSSGGGGVMIGVIVECRRCRKRNVRNMTSLFNLLTIQIVCNAIIIIQLSANTIGRNNVRIFSKHRQ